MCVCFVTFGFQLEQAEDTACPLYVCVCVCKIESERERGSRCPAIMQSDPWGGCTLPT